MDIREAIAKKKQSLLFALGKGGKIVGFRCYYYNEDDDIFEWYDFRLEAVKNKEQRKFLQTLRNIEGGLSIKELVEVDTGQVSADGKKIVDWRTQDEIDGTVVTKYISTEDSVKPIIQEDYTLEHMLLIMSRVYEWNDNSVRDEMEDFNQKQREEALARVAEQAGRDDDIGGGGLDL